MNLAAQRRSLAFLMPTLDELTHLTNFCTTMSKSPFYQKLGPGGIMAIFLTAREYDLPFMACLNGGLHTFDGKVTFSALMIDALILKAGHTTEVLKLDERSCRIRFTRGDRKHDNNYQPFEFEYTVEKAKKAGYLSKKNWQTSLDDMLYSRCLTGGARKHTPEVMVGVLVTGELVDDDRDGDIPSLLPPKVAETTNLLPKPTDSLIEFQKEEGFDEFCEQHELLKDSRKSHYIDELVKITNQPREKIINKAIKSAEKFLNAFEGWEKENPIIVEDLHVEEGVVI